MRYVGFGEHGGTAVCKDAAQLVYFNYDNMRYSQVYNKGPRENREPLYHADPFFWGFDSTVGRDMVYGIFVDNAGQICIDVGKESADKLLIGTRFNDMDYYFVLGDNPAQVLTDYTALVGRPRLKPRYALGYHQVSYLVTRVPLSIWGWCRVGSWGLGGLGPCGAFRWLGGCGPPVPRWSEPPPAPTRVLLDPAASPLPCVMEVEQVLGVSGVVCFFLVRTPLHLASACVWQIHHRLCGFVTRSGALYVWPRFVWPLA